jgi:hypothetical protein
MIYRYDTCSGDPQGGRKLDLNSANHLFVPKFPVLIGRRLMLGLAKRTFIRTASWVLSRLAVPLLPRGRTCHSERSEEQSLRNAVGFLLRPQCQKAHHSITLRSELEVT